MRSLVLVMGVSGTGKSTLALSTSRVIGEEQSCLYIEADDFHSPANIEKMSMGVGLSDEDREPWLRAVHERLKSALLNSDVKVVLLACSCLKKKYRKLLLQGYALPLRRVIVYLSVQQDERKVLRERLRNRKNHFAKETILDSQLATLEEPDATECDYLIQADLHCNPTTVTNNLRRILNSPSSSL